MFFGSSIAQGTVIVGQGLVVVDLRPDHRRVLGRLLGDNLALRRVLRIEPLAVAERLLSCPTIALPEAVLGPAYPPTSGPTKATSVGARNRYSLQLYYGIAGLGPAIVMYLFCATVLWFNLR